MRGRVARGLSASPTMIGAITTLIVIVAVFLAYNANRGLPFVPTYRVSVEVPNAARLTDLNEVRIGGSRVGVVDSMEVVEPSGGPAGDPPSEAEASDEELAGSSATSDEVARLNLVLDNEVAPLPEDSRFRVRYRSAFGLKYLEITRGAGRGAPEGFTFDDPESFIEQVEFDDIANTFDSPTRDNVRTNLEGFSGALAARGTSLNLAIERLDPLFRDLRPVGRTLARRGTRLRRLFPELADAARIVAPVAEQQAELFTNMAIAFAAISEDPDALRETISEGPPTLETGIETLPRQRPFLGDLTTLTRLLRPGVRDLRATLPSLNTAIRVGTPVLRRTPPLNRRLARVFRSLNRLVGQESTGVAIARLRELFGEARPLVRHVAPAQTVCNYFNYWFTFLPEHLSEGDHVGFSERAQVIGFPSGDLTVNFEADPNLPPTVTTVPGNVRTPTGGYSGLQANGKAGVVLDPPDGGEFRPYELPILHFPTYQPSGQTNADCQSGQLGYPLGDMRVPGQPRDNPAIIASDYPGSRGPTTLFYNEDRGRSLVDTRVSGRFPNR
jgi:ABC-type transporter Mla subunit MlaD